MKYCKECGVELENSMESCPLCNVPASVGENNFQENRVTITPQRKQVDIFNKEIVTKFQKREILRKLTLMILLSAIPVTFSIDLISSNNITWSKYTMLSCFILFLDINFLYSFRHKLFIGITGSYLLISSLFLILDTEYFDVKWSILLAIPVLTAIYISVSTMAFIIRHTKDQGINLIGYFFIITALFIIGLECCIDNYLTGKILLRWSLFVASSSFCISIMLLFVHHRLRKGRELKRLFHL